MALRDPLLDSVPAGVEPDLERTVDLLARVRTGDRAAVNALFLRCEERLRRIVRVRLGPGLRRWTESGDVVQEVFQDALAKLEDLDPASEFDLLDWLGRVATHRIRDLVDQMHALKRDVARTEELSARLPGSGTSPAALAADQTSPSGQAFRAEVRALLDEIVSGLPESYREVVLLRDYQGATWEEAARTLRTPTLHAAQQLHQRAWIKVRDLAQPRLAGLKES